jgi:hypothetical protein
MVFVEKVGRYYCQIDCDPGVGFSIIEVDHASHADCRCSCTDSRIRVVVTYFRYLQASRKVRGHDFAASFVEDWFLDTRIGRTKGFPVPKRCIQW